MELNVDNKKRKQSKIKSDDLIEVSMMRTWNIVKVIALNGILNIVFDDNFISICTSDTTKAFGVQWD